MQCKNCYHDMELQMVCENCGERISYEAQPIGSEAFISKVQAAVDESGKREDAADPNSRDQSYWNGYNDAC